MNKVSFLNAFSAISDAVRGKMRDGSRDGARPVSTKTTMPCLLKRLRMGLLLLGLLCAATMTAQTPLTWVISNGTLTISGDGAIPNYGTTSTTRPPWYGASFTSISLGSGVTSIGENAFRDGTGLTFVTIPSNIASIGVGAFIGCTNLRTVTIANGPNVLTIGGNSGNSNNNRSFPDGVETVSFGRNMNRLSGDGVYTNIFALFGTGVRQVTITGNNVNTIAASAFRGCTALTSATIANSVGTIGSYAFSGCTTLTSINIPDGVTTIDNYAFSGCTNLNSVTMGISVTTVGTNVFSGCTALTSIVVEHILSRISSVSEEMFFGCTALTSVTIPTNVIYIGRRAFMNCSNLRTVTVTDGTNALTIGGNAAIQNNNPSFPNGVETYIWVEM